MHNANAYTFEHADTNDDSNSNLHAYSKPEPYARSAP